jgi:hypothetical protein
LSTYAAKPSNAYPSKSAFGRERPQRKYTTDCLDEDDLSILEENGSKLSCLRKTDDPKYLNHPIK